MGWGGGDLLELFLKEIVSFHLFWKRMCVRVRVAVGYERIGAGSFTLAGARPGQKRQAEN